MGLHSRGKVGTGSQSRRHDLLSARICVRNTAKEGLSRKGQEIIAIEAHLLGGYFDLCLNNDEAEEVANQIVDACSDETRRKVANVIVNACNDEARRKMAVQILSLLSDSALLGVLVDLGPRILSAMEQTQVGKGA